MIGKAMNDGQLNSFIDKVIKPDAANRTNAFESAKQDLLAKIRGVTEAKPNATANPSGKVTITLPNGGTMLVDPDKAAAARAAIPGAK